MVLVQLRLFIPAMFLVLLSPSAYASEQPVYVFGVISQRSPLLTAQYWNPIIRHVSEKSGVPLRVRIGKSGPETSEMIKKGEVDFMFSNHIFHPDNESSGYSVIARDGRKSISGQIVVPAGSKIKKLSDLKNKKVVFPSKVAFVGYMVPIHHLHIRGIEVDVKFAGNQEGAMGQLFAGSVEAAGVNSEVMREFARREHHKYRILWTSKPYLNMPVAAKKGLPRNVVALVQKSLVEMKHHQDGINILSASAKLVGQKDILGFELANDTEYLEQKNLYTKVVGMQTAP